MVEPEMQNAVHDSDNLEQNSESDWQSVKMF